MPLSPEQLAGRLNRGLDCAYLLAGAEPLLVQEAADAVRAAARADGFDERDVLHAEPGFDWGRLREAGASLSLFSSRRIIELHLSDNGPGKDGAEALTEYLAAPPSDTVLIVLAGHLDFRARKAKWFKTFDETGAAMYAWPVDPPQLPGWIARRARAKGVRLQDDAVAALAERTEGNLLACAQELDRLALLFGDTPVDADKLVRVAADSARFDVFDLPAKVLSGDARGAARSIARLRQEGVDAIPAIWAMARELRLVHGAAQRLRGGDAAGWLNKQGARGPRQKRILAAARRLPPAHIARALSRVARLDQAAKGAGPGRPWEELVTLSVALAGERPPTRPILTDRRA